VLPPSELLYTNVQNTTFLCVDQIMPFSLLDGVVDKIEWWILKARP